MPTPAWTVKLRDLVDSARKRADDIGDLLFRRYEAPTMGVVMAGLTVAAFVWAGASWLASIVIAVVVGLVVWFVTLIG